MRFFILILIFINIGVLTYLNQNYFFQVESPMNNEELAADQLTLLDEHQLEALRKSQTEAQPNGDENTLDKAVQEIAEPAAKKADVKKPVETKPKLACYRWGEFSESEIAKAQAITAQLGLKSKLVKTTQTKTERYWVYMPPLASAEEAQSTAASLKAQGITDLYILNGPEWKNAISFGVFSDSRYADNMLKSLKAKGITNVLKAPRGKSASNRYRLNLKAVSKTDFDKLKAKQKGFPKAKLQLTKC